MNKNTKNKSSNLDNLSLDVYNNKEFVKSYTNKIEYNSHNALYERPAMISLMPELKGRKVLDAGCGPGKYTDIMLNKGAIVTAIDYSDEMIAISKEVIGDRAKIIKANLNTNMDFLNDSEFDVILCSMVIHYLKDLRNVFSEFNRILKTGGILIFSTSHPAIDFMHHPDGNYFDTEFISEPWPSYDVNVESFRRPLGDIFNILKECDFRIDEVLEPQPVEECKDKFPDAYHTLSTKPWFICFRVIKER